jgi:hypothetical protein
MRLLEAPGAGLASSPSGSNWRRLGSPLDSPSTAARRAAGSLMTGHFMSNVWAQSRRSAAGAKENAAHRFGGQVAATADSLHEFESGGLAWQKAVAAHRDDPLRVTTRSAFQVLGVEADRRCLEISCKALLPRPYVRLNVSTAGAPSFGQQIPRTTSFSAARTLRESCHGSWREASARLVRQSGIVTRRMRPNPGGAAPKSDT